MSYFGSGAFWGGAFDNQAGTGGFYTGVPPLTEDFLGLGTGKSWNGVSEKTRTELKRRQQQALSKFLRKTLGILTEEEQEEARRILALEAERLLTEQEAQRLAILEALAANQDDEAAILAAVQLDDEVIGSVVGIAAHMVAIKLKETLH